MYRETTYTINRVPFTVRTERESGTTAALEKAHLAACKDAITRHRKAGVEDLYAKEYRAADRPKEAQTSEGLKVQADIRRYERLKAVRKPYIVPWDNGEAKKPFPKVRYTQRAGDKPFEDPWSDEGLAKDGYLDWVREKD